MFIGEPNTGKTNILEALAFGCKEARTSLAQCCRVKNKAELFWNQDVTEPIEISFGDIAFRLVSRNDELQAEPFGPEIKGIHDRWNNSLTGWANAVVSQRQTDRSHCEYYLFDATAHQTSQVDDRLQAPFGSNIAKLLYANKDARQTSSKYFAGTGFRLIVDFPNQKVVVTKEVDDILFSFPYEATSETLRRMIFYHLALNTNKDTTLVFDEPEAHAFPPYTKNLAERIATDTQNNQFFLTTHSPYMLDSLLSKTPAKDLNVVLCRMEDFETKAHTLNKEQIAQLMDWSMDAFFNFERLLEIGK